MKKTLLAVAGSLSLVSCFPFSCIARGTLVSTPRGRRRIEDLVVQDAVWCVDPATGEQVASPITAVRSSKREVMRLEGEDLTLRCTTDHPLYDPLKKEWAPAGDWVLGHRTALLRVFDDGTAPRVIEVKSRLVADGVSEVFDLTVQHELHNFVAAGVLVHNKSPIRETCTLPDGGSTLVAADCTLPDGGTGFVTCAATDAGVAVGVCE